MTEKPVEMTMRHVLEGWDGDEVEVTLVTGEKVRGQISVFGTGELVAVGLDTDAETIYRIDAVIGARWIVEAS